MSKKKQITYLLLTMPISRYLLFVLDDGKIFVKILKRKNKLKEG